MAISIADSSTSPTRQQQTLSCGLLAAGPEKHNHHHHHNTKQNMWHRLGLRRLLGRDDRGRSRDSSRSHSKNHDATDTSNNNNNNLNNDNHGDSNSNKNNNNVKPHDNLTRRLSRKVGVGLPRTPTFKRQISERRDRLSPADPEPRRAVSADRRHTLSTQRTGSPQPTVDPRLSAPEVQWFDHPQTTVEEEQPEQRNDDDDADGSRHSDEWDPLPENQTADHRPDWPDGPYGAQGGTIEMELDKRWILNLSMHFRDRSEREKFFVTYAETPNRWRRVTISCDYRDAPPDSLEQDLKELRYQRDKCARVYESIRESLSEIQFYDTVTNLKLETRDGRLHVHVTEDVNEIIPYPPVSCVGHLNGARFIPEGRLHFDAHLSGFVYKVRLDGKDFIKKEIPGPDTVDEFLYEINALHALKDSSNVIQFEGIVVDDRQEAVKGLLISHADQGALVDILYEHKGEIAWERRERWAKQIVHGLCEIHEAGYVQGDFTLSNIVVDDHNNAKIIDINRRGCPVGWEPPEIAAKIESNQRISMYIGVKTDIYQLGMTLWALAMQEDEPERQEHPLLFDEDAKVPEYYRKLVSVCLSSVPRQRLSAKELLTFFPSELLLDDESPLPSVRRTPDTGVENRRSVDGGFSYHVTPPDLLGPSGGSYYGPAQDSLDDGYRSSQCASNSEFVPPYSDRNGHVSRDGNRLELGSDESTQYPPERDDMFLNTSVDPLYPDTKTASLQQPPFARTSFPSSSLLHSALPINPSLDSPKRGLNPMDFGGSHFNATSSSALDCSNHINDCPRRSSFLVDSRLPINPAVTETP